VQKASVRKALSIDNKFDRYNFIENKSKHAAALRKLISTEFAALSERCAIKEEDANA